MSLFYFKLNIAYVCELLSVGGSYSSLYILFGVFVLNLFLGFSLITYEKERERVFVVFDDYVGLIYFLP